MNGLRYWPTFFVFYWYKGCPLLQVVGPDGPYSLKNASRSLDKGFPATGSLGGRKL